MIDTSPEALRRLAKELDDRFGPAPTTWAVAEVLRTLAAEKEGAQPDFEAIKDKRMSELTPEQKDDALELWLRNNHGWFRFSGEHIQFLLKRLDKARASQPAAVPAGSEAERKALDRLQQLLLTALGKNHPAVDDWAMVLFGLKERDKLRSAALSAPLAVPAEGGVQDDKTYWRELSEEFWGTAQPAAEPQAPAAVADKLAGALKALRAAEWGDASNILNLRNRADAAVALYEASKKGGA